MVALNIGDAKLQGVDVGNVGIEVQNERQVEFRIRSQLARNGGPLTGTTVTIYHILHVAGPVKRVLIVTPNMSGMIGGQVIPCLGIINLNMIFSLGIGLWLININLADAHQERQLDALAPCERDILPAEAHTTVVVAAFDLVEFIFFSASYPLVSNIDIGHIIIIPNDICSLVVVSVLTKPPIIDRSHT